MIGTVTEENWRTVAAEIDGIARPDLVNQVTTRRLAMFAYRAEAEQWVTDQRAEGFGPAEGQSPDCIGSAAVSYFGPTDAPGNCWCASVERPAQPAPCTV